METYRTQHQVSLLSGPADRARLQTALAVYVRTTSPSLRTQSAQIQWKFDNPNNPFGKMFYASLSEDRHTVGFAMFGYYPGRRLVVIDHIAIDPGHRGHGSFFVFASQLQRCIESNCPDYDFIAAEIATDPEFSDDGTNGRLLIRLLRLVGFGQVHVPYSLPSLEVRGYRKPHSGALMLRGAQKVGEIRTEMLASLHHAILFEHYLPWFADFFGDDTALYRTQLTRLADELRTRMKGKTTLVVNGFDHDELAPKPQVRPRELLGVDLGTVGHVALFTAFVSVLGIEEAVFRPDARVFALTVVVGAVIYLALAAQASVTGLKIFERFGGMVAKLFSGMLG